MRRGPPLPLLQHVPAAPLRDKNRHQKISASARYGKQGEYDNNWNRVDVIEALRQHAHIATLLAPAFRIRMWKENCQFGAAFSFLVDYETPNQASRAIAGRQNVGRALCLHGTYSSAVFRARGFSRRLCPADPAGTGDFRRAYGDRGRHDDWFRRTHAG